MAVIQLAGMVFMAIGAVLAAVSHARGKFIRVEISNLAASAFSLIFLVWGLPSMGILAGAWGLFLRHMVHAALLLPVLGPICRPEWHRIPWRETGRRLRPLVFGTCYYKTDPLFDRILTSLAAPGSMTLLNLAQQLYTAAGSIFGKAIAAPMVPLQARLAVRGEWQEFRRIMLQRLVLVAVLTLGGWLLLVFSGTSLLSLLFAGRLVSGEIDQLWWLLLLLGGMLVGGALGTITSGAFYAKGETRIPTRLGVITYSGYVPLKILAFWKFGLAGLALSISGFYLLNLVLQLRYLDLDPSPLSPHADC
jgi:putative peptidoglycan lipid II flippase